MGRAEGVVHVDVGVCGQGIREGGIVLCLTRMEAEVLEENDLAGGRVGDRPGGTLAHAVFREVHPRSGRRLEDRRDRAQRERRVGSTLGTTEVRAQDDPSARVGEPSQGGQRCADARVVGHGAVAERHIEVGAHEHRPVGDALLEEGVQGGDHRASSPFAMPGPPRGWNSPIRCRTTT